MLSLSGFCVYAHRLHSCDAHVHSTQLHAASEACTYASAATGTSGHLGILSMGNGGKTRPSGPASVS